MSSQEDTNLSMSAGGGVKAKVRVKQRLASAIYEGSYRPGQKLPGGGRLARQLGVSPGTVHTVLAELERDGLVVRRHGSGTYVRKSAEDSLVVHVAFDMPDKLKNKHLVNQLHQHAKRQGRNLTVQVSKVSVGCISSWTRGREMAALFNAADPVGLLEVPASLIPAAAEWGLCEDLTLRLPDWPERDNVYQVAMDAVRHEGHVYALPFHVGVSGLGYSERAFERIKQDPAGAVGSPAGLVRAAEMLAATGQYEHSLGSFNARTLVMELLQAYYESLSVRFGGRNCPAIEHDVGVEVLGIMKRLKWQLNARIEVPDENGGVTTYHPESSFFAGRLPMLLTSLSTVRMDQWTNILAGGASEHRVQFRQYAWGPAHRKVGLLGGFVWAINPRVDAEVRDFLWSFLRDYVRPESQRQLDQFYVDNGSINVRSDAFISRPARIPASEEFDVLNAECLETAELEVPDDTPVFDRFVAAVHRIIFDEGADVEKEYEYYRSRAHESLSYFNG